MNTWLDTIKAAGVLSVAQRLGLRYRPNPAPGSLSPCPGCGAEQRGTGDKRGPIGLRRDHLGWICHRCKASGDALHLAALHITGNPRPDKTQWQKIRSALMGEGALPTIPVPAPRPARRPDLNEVLSLWKRAPLVCDDSSIADILNNRHICPETVAERNLCRVVPEENLPTWASCSRQSWHQSGHRALFPLFDHRGQLQSLHARRLAQNAERPKGLSPLGYEVAGLVLADANARALLQEQASWRNRLVIVEGAPDFLCASTHFGEEADTAVVGIISGSWTPAFSRRLPSHIAITIATHFDDAGDFYARKIRDTLFTTAKVTRWRPQHLSL
jgi:hypothetical protein